MENPGLCLVLEHDILIRKSEMVPVFFCYPSLLGGKEKKKTQESVKHKEQRCQLIR